MRALIELIIVFFGIGAPREIAPVDQRPKREPIFEDIDAWLRDTENFFKEVK
jgi:hypothetical protein